MTDPHLVAVSQREVSAQLRKENAELKKTIKVCLSLAEQWQSVYEDRSEQAMETSSALGSVAQELRAALDDEEGP